MARAGRAGGLGGRRRPVSPPPAKDRDHGPPQHLWWVMGDRREKAVHLFVGETEAW